MKSCTLCGTLTTPGSIFCPGCGSRCGGDRHVGEAAAMEAVPQVVQLSSTGRRKQGFDTTLFAVPVLVVAGCWMATHSGSVQALFGYIVPLAHAAMNSLG